MKISRLCVLLVLASCVSGFGQTALSAKKKKPAVLQAVAVSPIEITQVAGVSLASLPQNLQTAVTDAERDSQPKRIGATILVLAEAKKSASNELKLNIDKLIAYYNSKR